MKNIKVLITAGSTCVPIDSVRVITNVFKGRLGIEIAKQFVHGGFNVTLLLGNSDLTLDKSFSDSVNVFRFKYYDELLNLVSEEIKDHYDIIIHSAAVSDYKLVDFKAGKIKSGQEELILRLTPTVKIVDLFKKNDPEVFLIMFKLEVDKDKEELIEIAKKSRDRATADVIVANDFRVMNKNHIAYIIIKDEVITVNGKEDIAKKLLDLAYERFN